jgi:hypothetical protein
MTVSNPVPGMFIHDNYIKDPEILLEEVKRVSELEYSICPWKRSSTGRVDNPDQSDYRSSVECQVSDIFCSETAMTDPDFGRIRELLNVFLKDTDDLISDFKRVWSLGLCHDEGFRVIRYQNKAEYRMHHDHSETNARSLSYVAFLNDDFEGGELEFPYFDLTIKPEVGKVVLFPSNFPYSHIAHPVPEGAKYSMVSWYR